MALLVIVGAGLPISAAGSSGLAARNGVIAVATIVEQKSALRLVQTDGSAVATIKPQPFVDVPRFSPDGRRLAFWAGPDPDRAVPWIAAADGRKARPLLPVPDGREPVTQSWGPPTWAPDGRRLAYVNDSAEPGSDSYHNTIHLIRVADGARRALTLRASGGSAPPRSFSLLAWHGHRMLLAGNATPFVVDVRTGAFVRIPGTAALSPGGDDVVYVRGGGLFVVDIVSRRRHRLATADLEQANLAWAPNGQWIAFVRRRAVYIVARTGGVPTKVAAGPASGAQWSPDGRSLLINEDRLSRTLTIVDVRLRATRRIGLTGYVSGDWGWPMDWQSG